MGTTEGHDYKCVCVVKQLGAGALAGLRLVLRLCWIRLAELVPGLLDVEVDS